MGERIFVTGAAGFLGRHLVRRLADSGIRVRALAHHRQPPEELTRHSNIEWVKGDITDRGQMLSMTAGCSSVIHGAAAMRGSKRYQQIVNVEGTRSVFETALTAGVNHFLYISSIAVYGFQGLEENVYEYTPFRPTSYVYSLTKRQAESILAEVSENCTAAVSVIRPGMIYGPGGEFWTKQLFRLASLSPLPFIGDGSGSAHPIYVDDVVNLILLMLENPGSGRVVFNCAPDPAPTWREWLGCYAGLLDQNGWLPVKPSLIKPVALLAEQLQKIRGEPVDLLDMVEWMQERVHYRTASAKKQLNWQPGVSLEEGTQRCVPYLVAEGLIKTKNTGYH